MIRLNANYHRGKERCQQTDQTVTQPCSLKKNREQFTPQAHKIKENQPK